MRFIGRQRELDVLARELDLVRDEGQGRLVLLRGRRRVGKSRLVEELLSRHDVAALFFTATRGRTRERELARFTQLLDEAGLRPGSAALTPSGWDGALELLAGLRQPAVVVLDEFPWLALGDPEAEGAVQVAWDRVLQRLPVLLVLVGSEVAVMDALLDHDRPLFGRASRVVRLDPLLPAEVAQLLDEPAASVFDDYLVVGGYPELVAARARSPDREAFLTEQLSDPTTPLLVAGERAVNAEFPPVSAARATLRAIGGESVAASRIADRAGVPRPTLQRLLDTLIEARVVQREEPLAAPPGRQRRYRITDPALAFWLRYLDPGLVDLERDRGDLVADRIRRDWPDHRGRAIEPLVRDALRRRLPDAGLGATAEIGSWWTRGHELEVDVTGVDRPDRPRRVTALGTIRWRQRRGLDREDLRVLLNARDRVPGTDEETRLVGVSRTGTAEDGGFDLVLGPEDLLAA